jgi:hypothetical protein
LSLSLSLAITAREGERQSSDPSHERSRTKDDRELLKEMTSLIL